MFKRFESWVEALPDGEPTKPPTGCMRFAATTLRVMNYR